MNSKINSKGTGTKGRLDVVVVGFALFSMFFGAGNVIFPPFLGMQSGNQWIGGFTAYYIADIALAMVALFALNREGGTEGITNRLGKGAGTVLMTAIVLCIGPMFCIPRTAATTYEMTVTNIAPSVTPLLSSIIFFSIVFLLSVRESAVVDIVGKVLTPALLLGLFYLIIRGIVNPIGDIAQPQIEGVIVSGVQAGYQTMDVLGALLFGVIAISSIDRKGYDYSGKTRILGGAAIVSGVLLLMVYMGLAYLGATVSGMYDGTIGRAELVMAIVNMLSGKAGIFLFGIVVMLACMTTAIALICSSGLYFSRLTGGKVSYPVMVGIICVLGVVVANIGLDNIVAVAGPVLNVVYPPTLVLTAIALVSPKTDDHVSRGAVTGALLVSLLQTVEEFGISIPFMASLPFGELNLSWLVPALVGGILGFSYKEAVNRGKPETGGSKIIPMGK